MFSLIKLPVFLKHHCILKPWLQSRMLFLIFLKSKLNYLFKNLGGNLYVFQNLCLQIYARIVLEIKRYGFFFLSLELIQDALLKPCRNEQTTYTQTPVFISHQQRREPRTALRYYYQRSLQQVPTTVSLTDPREARAEAEGPAQHCQSLSLTGSRKLVPRGLDTKRLLLYHQRSWGIEGKHSWKTIR